MGHDSINKYAQYAYDKIEETDERLNLISDVRTGLGTLDNRLRQTINDLQAEYINISAARSQITDADLADEITEYTKNQIVMQSSQVVHSQTTATPRITLSLLGAIYDGLSPSKVFD